MAPNHGDAIVAVQFKPILPVSLCIVGLQTDGHLHSIIVIE